MSNRQLTAALHLGLSLQYVRWKQRWDRRRIPLTPAHCEHYHWGHVKRRSIERKFCVNNGQRAWRIWPEILERHRRKEPPNA